MAEFLQISSSKGVLELTSDLFEHKPFDARYQSIRYHTYHPIAPVAQNSKSIEFQLPEITSKCCYLTNNILLMLEVKMVKKDSDTQVDKTIMAAPVANIRHSLWDKVTLQVGDKELNQSPDCYHLRAYLQSVMNFTVEAQSEKCFMQGLERDTTEHYDSFDTTKNFGFKNRRNLFFHHSPVDTDSRYVTRPFQFCSVLYHDLCQNDRPILWGVPLKFVLTKAPRAFYMGCATADMEKDFELVITNIELRVQIAILSEKMITHIAKSLTEKKPALYYYRRFQVAKKPIG